MTRHEFLRALHRAIRPRNYLEIGVSTGASLTFVHVPAIGIDPVLRVSQPLRRDALVVAETSDDFFARPERLDHLRKPPGGWRRLLGRSTPDALDLAFIDGMHLAEFALRDFMNVERFSRWSSVIVFDDMLPRNVDEAARDRHTRMWAGDVYKVIGILREHRPDLTVLPINTYPTGLVVVLGADPANTVLRDRYEAIVASAIVPDPQVISESILERRDALDPARLLAAPFWSTLVSARNRGAERGEYEALRQEIAAFAAEPANVLTRAAGVSRLAAPKKRASTLRKAARRVIPQPVRAALRGPVRQVANAVRQIRG